MCEVLYEWMDLLVNSTHYPLWIYTYNQFFYKNSLITPPDYSIINNFKWNNNVGVYFEKEYFYLCFKHDNKYYVMGPIINHDLYTYKELEDIYKNKLKINQIPVVKLGYYKINHTFDNFQMWYMMVTQNKFPKNIMMNLIENELPFQRVQDNLYKNIIQSREVFEEYDLYDFETRLSKEIVLGNTLNALELVYSIDVNKYSKQEYSLVVLITVISRETINQGVLKEDALELQELLLSQLKCCHKTDDVYRLLKEMVTGYCKLIKNKEVQDVYWLQKIVNYIHVHLHEPIDLNSLAKLVNRTPSYISATFKKQMNMTFRDYLMKQRLEEAKYLLKHSDLTIIEISMMLCFCSPAHFTKRFKNETGLTPKEYRLK